MSVDEILNYKQGVETFGNDEKLYNQMLEIFMDTIMKTNTEKIYEYMKTR